MFYLCMAVVSYRLLYVNVNKSITAVFYHTKLTVCSAEMRTILYCIDVTLLMCGKWNTIAVCKCIFLFFLINLRYSTQSYSPTLKAFIRLLFFNYSFDSSFYFKCLFLIYLFSCAL